ncbi:MAG: anaerobic ribonucleoside-triphosphate reductase activating protein [Defluviitaleaceae bacterium]|nr:anaerobic ribonucleoside-triphosphate reductase activating protein [Defluviitaleaceae bacterium]
MRVKIAGIVNDSIVDGPGLRLTVFSQGCPHNCKGCHNPQTHDFDGGYYIDTDEIIEMASNNPLLSGVTLSGGEPFMQVQPMAEIAEKAHEIGLNVIIYTGYTWEELMANEGFRGLALAADYVVDGQFAEALRTLDMPFVGSSNQRVIDVKKSMERGKAVLHEF